MTSRIGVLTTLEISALREAKLTLISYNHHELSNKGLRVDYEMKRSEQTGETTLRVFLFTKEEKAPSNYLDEVTISLSNGKTLKELQSMLKRFLKERKGD